MLSSTSKMNFIQIWNLFVRNILDMKGSAFLVDPFKGYLKSSFLESLTSDLAHNNLHANLTKWGRVEQHEHKLEVTEIVTLSDGTKHKMTRFKDPDVRWARGFILTAFYNLLCLAAHKFTIEELIYIACIKNLGTKGEPSKEKAFYWLIGISKSFLLAEWSNEILHTAIANSDEVFFKDLRRWLTENTPLKRFDIARRWLGTTMLWYLGGNKLKRREFMLLLREYNLISHEQDEQSEVVAENRTVH